jgi:Flp pilus assembly protein TadB
MFALHQNLSIMSNLQGILILAAIFILLIGGIIYQNYKEKRSVKRMRDFIARSMMHESEQTLLNDFKDAGPGVRELISQEFKRRENN